MKIRPAIIVIIICVLGIAVSATTYLLGQNRADGVFTAELDVNALQRKVESGEAMLVYFYGRSCEDCAASEPYLVEALTQARDSYLRGIPVYRCEREANATVRSLYGVEGTPTLIVFEQGQEFTRLEGPLFSAEEYDQFLRGL